MGTETFVLLTVSGAFRRDAVVTGVGIARTRLGIARTRVGIVRTRLGIARTGVGIARARLGIVRTEVGIARTGVGIVRTRLGITRTGVGIARARLGIVRTEVTAQRCPFSATFPDTAHRRQVHAIDQPQKVVNTNTYVWPTAGIIPLCSDLATLLQMKKWSTLGFFSITDLSRQQHRGTSFTYLYI
uniref:Uncharacterized protein n=1 Tax=Molossus molossus TaxID=27622 RepID=A0A7J8GK63_MOLMO|nr:hypothetical protein HJG59_011412 [Molossus molossus]